MQQSAPAHHYRPLRQEKETMNLRDICKERLLSDMVRSIVPQVGSGWKVMIVDHNSMRVISAACKMYDVMEENVTGMYLCSLHTFYKMPILLFSD